MRTLALAVIVLSVLACERGQEGVVSPPGDASVTITSGTMAGGGAVPTIIVTPPSTPAPTVNVTIAMPGSSAGAPAVSVNVSPSTATAPATPTAPAAPAPSGGGAVMTISPRTGRPTIVNSTDVPPRDAAAP